MSSVQRRIFQAEEAVRAKALRQEGARSGKKGDYDLPWDAPQVIIETGLEESEGTQVAFR